MTSPSLSPREELLQIQRRIFVRNDELIRAQALVRERGFAKYEGAYRRRVKNYERVSSQEELQEATLESDLIYLGDYHTNKQSQRTLLRLLKMICDKIPSLGVGLELIQKRHQPFLNAYLQDKMTEEDFLQKIQFRKNWYFDLWENFKPLFDFARHRRLPLFAIEWSLSGDATLAFRDRKSSEIVASLVRSHPDMKFIFFVGDLHIAPSHLPLQVERGLSKLGIHKKSLLLYQNSESIYWQLAEDEVEDKIEIVKISANEFCIINTPPIIWQQSFLNWLEHEGESIDYDDAKHSFLEILHRIAGFLGIEVGPEAEAIEVFTCGDLSFLKKLSENGDFSKREIESIKRQILAAESYCIPQKHYVYLANLSMNHAAEEAAHSLKSLCSGVEGPREPVDAFYANTLHEALGFFGSKIINHKRKCFHENEYRSLIDYLKSIHVPSERQREMEMALLILEHKELEKKGIPIRSQGYFKSRHDLFFGVTHGLGYMLGDRLYYGLLEGKVTKEEMRGLFGSPLKEGGEAFQVYKTLLRKVRGVKIPRRV